MTPIWPCDFVDIFSVFAALMQRFIAFASLLAYLPSHGSHTVVTCTRCSYVNWGGVGGGGWVGGGWDNNVSLLAY